MRRLWLLLALAAGLARADERRSGFDTMTPELQAMQRDDGETPAMLFARDGEALWREGVKPCAQCHGEAASSMRGAAARHPAFDEASGQPVNLAQKINLCRQRRQGEAALAYESPELLALEAYVALQSRGLPVAPPDDARLAPARGRGQRLYFQRQGQIDLSCSQCHDDNWGKRLGGSRIPQGHATGYPLYRLEWQAIGSLQRRIRNCMIGVRAEPFAYGAAENVELELYLAQRAAGLAMDAPAVRP